jgi:hypothetical protein
MTMTKTHRVILINVGIFLIFIITALSGYCQKKAMTFSEAAIQGNTLQHLDSIYLSGVHIDTAKAAFSRVLYDSVHNAYIGLIKDFEKYLSSKRFRWGKKTQCFNKIYFSSSGEIDLFLYNFTSGQVNPNKITDFENLLNEFIKGYRYPIVAKNKFSLCSSVMYDD